MLFALHATLNGLDFGVTQNYLEGNKKLEEHVRTRSSKNETLPIVL